MIPSLIPSRPLIPSLPGPLVVAHRGGAWPGIPGEQKVAHFEKAIAAGADLIEVDLRRTADGHIICQHDPELQGLPVATSTLDALSAAARAAGQEPPVLLSTLLQLGRGRIHLDLEIKEAGFEAQLVEQVRAGFEPDRVVYKSFLDAVLRRLRRLDPDCRLGLLLGVEHPRHGALTRMGELFPGWRLWRSGADFVCPHHRLLRLGFARRMHLGGRPVLVWTVNEQALTQRLLREVDGIITDDPAGCLALRGR